MAGGHPRFAVIVPCFNDGATVEHTIESALNQERVEIVVVDDGSTDPATLDALERVRACGVQVVRQQNGGPAAARMAGLRCTSAPYVFPLDADDVLMPGALAVLADALDDDPGLSAVWGDYQMFGQARSTVHTPAAIDPWTQTHLNELPMSALFRRTAIVAAGGWRLTIGYEDWDLWLSLAGQGARGKRVPIIVYRYRVHSRRGWRADTRNNRQITAELHRRHPALFASRRENWARSSAPRRLRLGLPLASALPLPTRARLALMHTLSDPRAVVGAALDRRLTGLRARRLARHPAREGLGSG